MEAPAAVFIALAVALIIGLLALLVAFVRLRNVEPIKSRSPRAVILTVLTFIAFLVYLVLERSNADTFPCWIARMLDFNLIGAQLCFLIWRCIDLILRDELTKHKHALGDDAFFLLQSELPSAPGITMERPTFLFRHRALFGHRWKLPLLLAAPVLVFQVLTAGAVVATGDYQTMLDRPFQKCQVDIVDALLLVMCLGYLVLITLAYRRSKRITDGTLHVSVSIASPRRGVPAHCLCCVQGFTLRASCATQ